MQAISLKAIYFSLLLALLCMLLPWAGYGLMLRPDFLLLVSIYWTLRAPRIFNIGAAWCVGLIVDLATGGLFGQHALAYALTAFVAVSYQRRLALFNPWQQAGYVFVLLLFAQIILLILKLFAGEESPGWSYFLSSISSIVLWQLVIFSNIGSDSQPHKN